MLLTMEKSSALSGDLQSSTHPT
ncbi:hypothetical protein, partial [Streptomyces albus]